MKSCLRGGSGVLSDILYVRAVGGDFGEGSVSGSARRRERLAGPPGVEAGNLTQVFVANPLFANRFDRERGFDDAFVVVHAGLRFGKIWNYANMKIIA